MKIVILGATGFVGRNVLKQALEASHEVTVLVRDARKLGSDNSKLKVIEGDARKYQDVKKAITGQDVVIQTLGLGGQGYGKPNDTVSQATRILVDIMSQEKRGYLVCVSNAGVGSSENFGPWWMRKLIPLFFKWLVHIQNDKRIMEQTLINSDIKWSIIRCPKILDKNAKQCYRTSKDGKGIGYSISVVDVARFLLSEGTSQNYLHQPIAISN